MVIGDPIMHTMAVELHGVLLKAGIDPQTHPDIRADAPPSLRAFKEYQRRGGTVYTDANDFARSLVEQVKSL
jgi:ribosomal protein S30